jgi:hypothetical protein
VDAPYFYEASRGISATRSALKPSADYGQLGSRRQPSGAIPTRPYRDLQPGVHQDLINYSPAATRQELWPSATGTLIRQPQYHNRMQMRITRANVQNSSNNFN